jgi:hypothetical protein
MTPLECQAILSPAVVEYRQSSQHGVRIIRVLLGGTEARVMAWTESFRPSLMIQPMSISLPEAIDFIEDAKKRNPPV